jgi:histidinol phosphatase-like enzyme
MALRAKKDFHDIDFKKSIMVGNSPSDMKFGKNAGMTTVLISRAKSRSRSKNADYMFSTIGRFCLFLRKYEEKRISPQRRRERRERREEQ